MAYRVREAARLVVAKKPTAAIPSSMRAREPGSGVVVTGVSVTV
jgi:hypothetical protein